MSHNLKNKLILIGCLSALVLSIAGCGEVDSSSKKESAKTSSSSVENTDDTLADPVTEEECESSNENSAAEVVGSSEENISEIISKVKNNVESKNCKMDVSAMVAATVTADGSEIQNVNNSMTVEAKSTDKGMYSKTTTVSKAGTNDTTEIKEEYIVYESNTAYTTTDEGKTWNTSVVSTDELTSISDGVFDNEDVFQNAEVAKNDEGYIIKISLTDLQSAAEDSANAISAMSMGMSLTGDLIITIDNNYFPASVEMSNVEFDTEEMLKARSEIEGAENTNFDMDVNMSLKIDYSDWNMITDDEVTPPAEALSTPIPAE